MVDQPRPLTVRTPLGSDATLLAFRGTEAISELFRFQLDLVVPNGRAVPFDALLGQPVGVRVEPPKTPARYFAGICSRLSQGASDEQRTAYRLEVVPQLWLLTRTASVRAFHDLSAPEILARVLDGQNPGFELQRSYPKREYVVQYRESDFDFAARLMEEEGIWWVFRHDESGHRLVVADSAQSNVGLPAVQFDPKAAPGTVFAWEKSQELAPGAVTLRDHDFTLPEPIVEGGATIPRSAAVGGVEHLLALPANEELEVYDFPGAYAQRFDGVDEAEEKAGDRMASAVAASIVASGESTAAALSAGHRFTLERHFDADGAYVLTRVSHDALLVDPGAQRLSYTNSFTCIPESVAFRPPRRAPRPAVGGVQTAVVVGPPGEEIHTDEFGRVRVRFHWDRDDTSSTWLRVAQQNVGGSMFWLPEVGDEVLVAFEQGDPDRPYVLGRLFNATDRPPETREEEAR